MANQKNKIPVLVISYIIPRPLSLSTLHPHQLPCSTCQGSGLCPACNGEGFQNRNPGRIEAAKLRAGSPTAATRYTAG